MESVSKKDEELHISFNPLVIRVLDHDVSSIQVLFPLIGAKLQKKNNGRLFFDKFTVIGNFRRIVTVEDFTAVDQTLTTNWTHGGEFKGGFDIIININQ